MPPLKNSLLLKQLPNGKEFAEHKLISPFLNVDFTLQTRNKSCQIGLNENFNGLIRQYIPKKTDFKTIDNQYIEYVENKINNRPRKKMKFLTPIEKFYLSLHNQKVAFVT